MFKWSIFILVIIDVLENSVFDNITFYCHETCHILNNLTTRLDKHSDYPKTAATRQLLHCFTRVQFYFEIFYRNNDKVSSEK